MSYLKERILEEGVIYPGNVLKIDSFLNHQIDPGVMKEIEKEFYDHFSDRRITKIMTVEASGIAPAIMVAAHFDVPMLFAKKARPATEKTFHPESGRGLYGGSLFLHEANDIHGDGAEGLFKQRGCRADHRRFPRQW